MTHVVDELELSCHAVIVQTQFLFITSWFKFIIVFHRSISMSFDKMTQVVK